MKIQRVMPGLPPMLHFADLSPLGWHAGPSGGIRGSRNFSIGHHQAGIPSRADVTRPNSEPNVRRHLLFDSHIEQILVRLHNREVARVWMGWGENVIGLCGTIALGFKTTEALAC